MCVCMTGFEKFLTLMCYLFTPFFLFDFTFVTELFITSRFFSISDFSNFYEIFYFFILKF